MNRSLADKVYKPAIAINAIPEVRESVLPTSWDQNAPSIRDVRAAPRENTPVFTALESSKLATKKKSFPLEIPQQHRPQMAGESLQMIIHRV